MKSVDVIELVDIYHPPDREIRRCKYRWFDAWDWLVNRVVSALGTPRLTVSEGEVAIDPHIHTLFSHCSISQPEDILLRATGLGLGAVAIMDHNEVGGARDVMRCANELKRRKALPEEFLVIPGTEVNSSAGHIGALFVTEKLPMGLAPEETVRIIHEEGGLAVAVHPYHSTGIGDAVFDAPFDAVEIECGAVFGVDLAQKNRMLSKDPRLSGVTKLGSSDAHFVKALASCYTVLKMESPTLECAKKAISQGLSAARNSIPHIRLQKILGGIPKLH